MSKLIHLSVVTLLALSATSCQEERTSSSAAEADNLVGELFAAWSEHEPERLNGLFADNGIYEDVPAGDTYTGPDEIKDYLRSVFTWAPDFRVNLTFMAVSGETVVVEWTMEGTQTGPIDGFPATGNRFSVKGASVIELENGKIRRNTDYYDMATFAMQLGAVIIPPAM
jgi:steroid delta-isomerase-like uncharacterized protein